MESSGARQPNRESAPFRELPVVAIVGKPNVGKSTLFNRIVGGRQAIVDDEPGVTRDRNYRETHWAGKRFFLVDTGGLVPGSKDTLESLVRKQVEAAINEAAVVVFLTDAGSGVTALDRDIAELLRQSGKKHIVVANKMDTRASKVHSPEFYELGLGDFIGVSAEQGTDIGELLDVITGMIPEVVAEDDQAVAIAVIGKPNVGKSSLINRWTGKETVIVDGEPGTTRDSIDTFVRTKYGLIRLVDTAGLRRKSRTKNDLEKYANIRSVAAIDRSAVVVLMLDSETGLAKQDLTIASYVERSGKGMVIAWNKWDLHDEGERKAYTNLAKRRLRHLPYVPLVFISCHTGEGLEALLGLCIRVHGNRDTRIPTGVLNRMLRASLDGRPPTSRGRRFGKIYYIAQTSSKPPCFTIFVNDPSLFGDNYLRNIEKRIRGIYPFEGTPLRIRVRKSQ
jgi:GTP-binding protein